MHEQQTATLSAEEKLRYRRHLLLPDVGMAGQERLKASKIACVGAGGLGSPVALYLAAAGVGTLGLVDSDCVDLTNLQRQILFTVADIGSSKVGSGRARLEALNPEITVKTFPCALSADNAREILSQFDIVIDGSDNFQTRYLVNDVCAELGKPDVWAAVYRFEGQIAVFDATRGPCYRCLFAEPPAPGQTPSCAEGGVFGAVTGIMGTLQANEAIKLVLGCGSPLVGRLLVFDALAGSFTELAIAKQSSCPVCAASPRSRSIAAPVATARRSAGTVESMANPSSDSISCETLEALLAQKTPLTMLDCREPAEWEICHLEGSVLMPMRTVLSRLGEFAPDLETVVVCHHGPRSELVAEFLRERGFQRVRWLEGGLEAWADRIDPQMARY